MQGQEPEIQMQSQEPKMQVQEVDDDPQRPLTQRERNLRHAKG